MLLEEEYLSEIAGRWKPVRGIGPTDWMLGMEISQDGSFRTKWNGYYDRHEVTDGQVVVLDKFNHMINLKRTCYDANDHHFQINPEWTQMTGRCPQSGANFILQRVAQDDESWLRD